MLKKYWKKIGMLILIIACVFNVMNKLVHKISLNKEMLQSAQYIFDEQKNENKQLSILGGGKSHGKTGKNINR